MIENSFPITKDQAYQMRLRLACIHNLLDLHDNLKEGDPGIKAFCDGMHHNFNTLVNLVNEINTKHNRTIDDVENVKKAQQQSVEITKEELLNPGHHFVLKMDSETMANIVCALNLATRHPEYSASQNCKRTLYVISLMIDMVPATFPKLKKFLVDVCRRDISEQIPMALTRPPKPNKPPQHPNT